MARRVLIEGWRGISHSYALVNQHQILALLDRPEVKLFHRDLPFFGTRWNEKTNSAGFDAARRARIDAVPPPDGGRFDTIYRIGYPPRGYGGDAEKIFCFNTLEYFGKPIFYDGPEAAVAHSNQRVTIVTPSNWARSAFLASGVDESRVVVVPHGVDPATFRPLGAAERLALRRQMGIAEDAFVFLNVSAMTVNKGIDLLLRAFEVVHARHPRARLVLKDHGDLYLTKAADRVAEFRAASGSARAATTILSQNVSLAGMRQIYALCDAYVSPYCAEGFNLPPLEAAACGTPLVVTAGGPTDDYADPAFALKIASRPAHYPRFGGGLAPDLDSLIDCMERLVSGRASQIDMSRGAALVRDRHSWARVADRLVALF
jgi:glycosyltransferase involved in cell wall biosynthesis